MSRPSGTPQLFGELLQAHEPFQPLLHGELEAFADQRAIDVALVRFDDGIGLESRRLNPRKSRRSEIKTYGSS